MGKRWTNYFGIGGHYPDHSIPGTAGVYDSVIGYWRGTCDCGTVFVQFAAHSAKHIRGTARYSSGIRESATALGLSDWAQLRLVTLPMASRSILAGIKTSAVINVGTATLGALIGAGGYGQPILTGIRLDDIGLILQGAVPAALLALIVQGLFELFERVFVSRGLRLKGEINA